MNNRKGMTTPNPIYMYHTDGGIYCAKCNKFFRLRSKALAHLLVHRANDKDIPDSVIFRFSQEIRELGDKV